MLGSARVLGLITDWRLTIAHPDFADWATVAAYCVTATLTARAARLAAAEGSKHERLFWRVATWFLIVLAINELLDLQTLFTVIGRAHAQANGWYEGRRSVQYAFVVALGAGALVAGATLLWLMKGMHGTVRLALAGFVFIGLFVLARASSIHHLEDVLGRGPAMFNLGSMQEVAGIAIVAVAAVMYGRGSRTGGNVISSRLND